MQGDDAEDRAGYEGSGKDEENFERGDEAFEVHTELCSAKYRALSSRRVHRGRPLTTPYVSDNRLPST